MNDTHRAFMKGALQTNMHSREVKAIVLLSVALNIPVEQVAQHYTDIQKAYQEEFRKMANV